MRESRRRRFLQGLVVTAAGSLAGCSNDSDADDEEDEEAADGTESEATGTAAPSSPVDEDPVVTTSTQTRTTVANPEEKLDNWLSNANNYNGTIQDKRSEARVTVSVGADGQNDLDGFAFDPPAFRITTGTEVTWLWTGEGGKHNVRDRRGRFYSGEPEEGGGTTFLHTFEQPGLYRYKCTKHGDVINMRGALIVEY